MPKEPTPALTREICAFALETRIENIPVEVLARGRIHILDTLGVALAGAKAEASGIVRDHIEALGAAGQARIFGTGVRTAPRFAAMANGTAMHTDNFDDTSPQAAPDRNGGIHASAAALPAALALAEERGLGGAAVSAAYHVGVEIACRLNHAVDNRHYQGGFHTTGTLNVFGAAAAAARLIGLDAARTSHAIAIAASQASGIRANFGAMAEQTHAGHAAECGLNAADLARRGLTGAADAMEARFGWMDAASLGGGWVREAICGRLGRPWAFEDPGMSIKPWPNGALTHPAMTLVSRLRREHGIAPEAVEAVSVRTNARVRDILVNDAPADAMQAKFSIPFAVGCLLVEGHAGLAEFTDETVARDDVRAMMARISYTAYEREEPGYTNLTTLVEIRLADGTVHKDRADQAVGGARNPMSWDEALEKFRGCCAYAGMDAARADGIAAMVAGFEDIPDIGALTARLAG
ncbi:MAG: MmgE/PrpD family protein [Alphaproteobacteria bacterium]|nr:MmgE/PrpD family protein [Alphaproteobacteria bacterium]